MNIHRLRVVDYDTAVNEDEGNSAITEHDKVSGNSQKDSDDAKVMVDGKTTTSDENGGGDQNVTTDSTTNPALPKRLCLRKRRSNNELFRFPSQTKLKKHACKKTSSSEDLKKTYKTNERSNQRSRYNLIFNRDSILNVISKGGDVKKNRKHDNRNEECNDRFSSQKLNLTTRAKNQSREKSRTPKLCNDMFGFQKTNRRFDPCLYKMSCHFFDIDNYSAFNMFKKPFRRKQLRKKIPNEAKNIHHQVRVLNTEEHVNAKEEVDKYYSITANENSHKQRPNRKPYVDTWRSDYSTFNLRKDANVFVSSSALAPITKYCIDRACGCSICKIAPEKQSSSENKSLNMKSQSVICECVKLSSEFLNTMTACDANLPRTSTTRSSMKNICLGLLIFLWSPCLLVVILALIIIFPWRMSRLLGNNGLKCSCANSSFLNKITPKCLVHECQQIRSRYLKSQRKSVLSSVASWFTRVAGSAATSVYAMLSLVKLNKNRMPTCAGSSFVPKGPGKHPNPKNRYDLYYVNDRGWVMKPVYHRSLYQNMRCERSPTARHSSRLKKLRPCCISKDKHTTLKDTKADGCLTCYKTSSKNKGEASCSTSKDLNPPPTCPCSPITKQVNITSKQNNQQVGVKNKSNTVCSCMYQPISAYTNTVKFDKTAYLPHYCVDMLYGITPNYPCGIHCGGIAEQKTQHIRTKKNTQIQKATCKRHQSTSIDDISNLHGTGIEQTQQSKITQTVFSDKIDKTHVTQDRLIKSYPNQQASDIQNRALRLVNRDFPLTSNSYQQTSYTPYTSENDLSHILESKFKKEFSNKLKRDLRDVRNNELVDRATSYKPAIMTGKRTVNKSNNILQNKLVHCNTVFDKRLTNLHPTISPLFKRDSNWICAIEEQGATSPFMPKAEQQVNIKKILPEKAVNTSQKKSISFVRASTIPKTKQSILCVQSRGTIFPSASIPQSKKDSDPRKTKKFLSFMKASPRSIPPDLINPENLAIFAKMSHCPCEYNDTEKEVPLCKIKTNDHVFKKYEIKSLMNNVLPFLKTAAKCCKTKCRKANLLVAKEFQRTKKIICHPSYGKVKIEKQKQMPSSLDKIKCACDVVGKRKVTKTETKGTATSLSLEKAPKRPTKTMATNTSKILETLCKFGQAKKESGKKMLSDSSSRALIDKLHKTCFARFKTTGTQTSRDKASECGCAIKEVGTQTDLVEQKKCKATITKPYSPLQSAPNCGYKTKQTNTFPCDGKATECDCQTKITDTPRSRKIVPKYPCKVGETQTDKPKKKLSELTNQYTKREASTSYEKVSKTKEMNTSSALKASVCGHRTQDTSTSPSLEKAFKCPLNTKETKTSPSLQKPIECPCNAKETKTLPVLAKAIMCGCRTKETNMAPPLEKAVECSYKAKKPKASECGCAIKEVGTQTDLVEQKKCKATITKPYSPLQSAPNCGYKTKQTNTFPSDGKATECDCQTKITDTPRSRKIVPKYPCKVGETQTDKPKKKLSELTNQYTKREASNSYEKVSKTKEMNTSSALKASVCGHRTQDTSTSPSLEKAFECPLNTKETKTSPSLQKPIECPCNAKETKTLPVLAKAIMCGCRTKETNTAPPLEKAVECSYKAKKPKAVEYGFPSLEKAVQCGFKIKRKDNAKKKRTKKSLSLEKADKCCCMTKETNTSSLRKKACERCCQTKETNISPRHKKASECDYETKVTKKSSQSRKKASECSCKTKESKTFWSRKKASHCACKVKKTQTHVAKKMWVDPCPCVDIDINQYRCPYKPEVTQTRTPLEKAIQCHFENIDKSVSVIAPCDGAYEKVFTQMDLTKSLDEALSHRDQFPSYFCLGDIKPPKQKRQLKVSQHFTSQKKTLHNQPRQKFIKSHRRVKQSHQTHSWSINREHTNVTENRSPSKSPQNLIPCQASFISNTHENQPPQDQCNSSMYHRRTDIPQNRNQSTSLQNCSQLELSEILSPQASFISYQHDLQSRHDQSTPKESKTSLDRLCSQGSLYYKSTVSLQNSPQKISSRESYPMNPKGANGRTYEIPKQYQRRPPQRLSLSPDLPSGLSDEPHDASYNTSVPTWNKVLTTNGPPFRFSKLKSKPVRVPVISNDCFCPDEELQERRNPSAKLLSFSLRKPGIPNKMFQQPKKPYSSKTKFSRYSVRAVSCQSSITSLVRSCQSSLCNQASFSSRFTSHRIPNVPKNINCTRPEKYFRWLKFGYNSDILNKTSSNIIYKSSHTSKTSQRISLLNNKHIITSTFVGNNSQRIFNKPNKYSQKLIQHSQLILDPYTRKSKLSKSTQIRHNTPSHKQNVKRLLSKCNQTSKHLFFVTDNSPTKLFKPSRRFSHKTILKDRYQQTYSQNLPTSRCVTPRCEPRTRMSGLSISVHSKQELPKHSCHKTSLESRLQSGLSNNFFYNQPTSSQHIEPIPRAHISTNKSNPLRYYLFPYPHNIFGPIVHPGQRLDIAQVSSPHSFRCPLSEQNDPVLNNSVCPANKQSESGHTEPYCKSNILSKKSLRKQQSCQTAGREKEILPYTESDNSLNKHEQASVQIECKCSDEDVLERQQYPSEDTDAKIREIPRITKSVGCTAKQSSEHTDCESFSEKSLQNQQYQSKDTHVQTIKEKSLHTNGVCCTKEHSSEQIDCKCYDKKMRQSQLIAEKKSQRQMPYLPCSGAPLNYRSKTFKSPEKAKMEKLPSKELREKEKRTKFDQAMHDRCLEQQKKFKPEVKKAKMKKKKSEELSCWQQIKEGIKESEDQAWPLEVNCNRMYIHTLKHRPHLWLFKLWPSLYPYFLNVFEVHSCVCQMLLYITTACLCCPFFLCFYYCSRGLLCHDLC